MKHSMKRSMSLELVAALLLALLDGCDWLESTDLTLDTADADAPVDGTSPPRDTEDTESETGSGEVDTDTGLDTDTVIDTDDTTTFDADSDIDRETISDSDSDSTTATTADSDMSTGAPEDSDSETESESDWDTHADTVSDGADIRVDLIDGNGSRAPIVDVGGNTNAIVDRREAEHRFRDQWVIAGEGLDKVVSCRLEQVEGDRAVFTSADGLAFTDGGTSSERILQLPETLVPGLFTLILEGGPYREEVSVYVLKGEKGDSGPGITCDGNECTLTAGDHLAVNGNVSIAGELVAGSVALGGDLAVAGAALLTTATADSVTAFVSHALPDCPQGYEKDSSVTETVLCRKDLGNGRFDEMVQVGDFWIDRYEVSAWQNPDCSGAQYAVSSDNWPLLRDGSGSEQAFACSVEGALPAINTSWFRAVRSCAASGKSLCSNAEWQAAVASTFDPGANGEGARCHTDADATRPSGQGTGAPGSVTACVSRYGAEDMIGNVEEYVEDWFVAGRRWQSSDADNKAVPFFFSGHDDATWNLNGTSSAPTGAFVYGMPSGATRGGHYFFDVRGGVNAFILNLGPECSHYGIGTRCCISY